MTAETIRAALEFASPDALHNLDSAVRVAGRVLHLLSVASRACRSGTMTLVQQVVHVYGFEAACCLARLLSEPVPSIHQGPASLEPCDLEETSIALCLDEHLPFDAGRRFMASVIRILHDESDAVGHDQVALIEVISAALGGKAALDLAMLLLAQRAKVGPCAEI